MDRNTKGVLAIFVCALLWSTSGLFIKIIDWNPMVIAGSRSLIAASLMLALRLGASGRTGPSAGSAWGKIGGKPNRVALIGAALANAATMILFVIANKLTASANVILLQYSAPIWAAVLGWWILKEKLRTEHWAALGAVVVGLYLFFKDGLAQGSFLGDALALVSGLTFAAYSVLLRQQKDGRPEDSILLAHLITAAVCLPFIFIDPPRLEVLPVLSVLALGIFQIGLASLLFAYGIRRVSAVQAMLTAVAEPVFNPVWVFIVTRELPGASAVAGGSVILTAVIASSIVGARREKAIGKIGPGPDKQDEVSAD